MMRRRDVLTGGCALLTLFTLPDPAHAGRHHTAPRFICPHGGCRHHRPEPGEPGVCALALKTDALIISEEEP